MDILRQARFAFRRLAKFPGSTLVATLAIAFGIGLTASMFSVLDGMFLRGLPFADSERLMHLERNNLEQGIDSMEVPEHDFDDWRRQQTAFESLAGFTMGTFNLADDDNLPERYDGAWISPSFLDLLRVEPLLGRGFEPEDERPGAPRVLLLSYQVWQQRYASSPDVVGKVVRLNAEPATVVGVLPQGFAFPIRQTLWMPLVLRTDEVARGEGRTLEVFGRLAPGQSLDQAQVEMSLIAGRLAQAYPEANQGVGAVVQPYLDEFIGERARMLVGVMMTAVVLVLVIACFNVANVLIGRASTRSRELAIRTALGSSRWGSVNQVLAEASLIACAGAVLGVGMAWFGVQALAYAIERDSPGFWVVIELGPRSVLVALVATVLSALLAGLVPALQASRPNLTEALQDTGRGSTSFRLGWLSKVLVVSQVAVSAALLVGSGMTVRSILAANAYDLQFDQENLLVARLGLMEASYPDEPSRVAFFENLRTRLASNPSVRSVAIGTTVPLDTSIGAGGDHFQRPGETYEKPWQMPWSRRIFVSPGYFDTLGVPILAGRDFGLDDRQGTPIVAIVNQDFARREWGDESPIGKKVDLWIGEEAEAAQPNAGVVEVVGLVPNLRMAEFDNADDQHGIYLPMAQESQRFAWVIVKTRGEPLPFSETVRREVLALDPDLPLYFVRSMDQVIEQTMFIPNLIATMFGTFGVVAMLVACIGLYGLMSFAVTQRVQEMGVRMALGARAREVVTMVLSQGMKQTGVGLAIGLALGLGLSKLLSSVLFRVGFGDPLTFGAVAAMLLGVALLASFWPAMRASSVDPIEALRHG